MNIKIANKLVELRKKNGLSQEELADKLGLSRQAVSKWERAESSPDTDNLICLAKLYNVSLDELLNTDETIEEISREVKEREEEKGKEIERKTELSDAEIKRNKRYNLIEAILSGSLFIIVTIIYFIVSFAHPSEWGRLWILYLFPIVIMSVVRCLKHRRFCEFLYPVFATIVFLALGFYAGLFHPGWLVFITIPVFYSVFGPIDKAIAEKRHEPVEIKEEEKEEEE